MSNPPWNSSPAKRAQIAAIAAAGYPLFALLGLTLRFHVDGRAHYEALLAAERPFILALWHGRILPCMIYFRHRGLVVMTSQNFDGEWIARIIQRFGYGTVRGSSSRNAAGAARQMVRDIRAGRSMAFTVDGPSGPAGVAKPGAIWLARVTGCPILPCHAEATRHRTLHSWDRSQIPKPFSRVAMVIGRPVEVPRDGSEEDYRHLLEHTLASLKRRALQMLPEIGT